MGDYREPFFLKKVQVDSEGFEPPTSRVQGGRSTN